MNWVQTQTLDAPAGATPSVGQSQNIADCRASDCYKHFETRRADIPVEKALLLIEKMQSEWEAASMTGSSSGEITELLDSDRRTIANTVTKFRKATNAEITKGTHVRSLLNALVDVL